MAHARKEAFHIRVSGRNLRAYLRDEEISAQNAQSIVHIHYGSARSGKCALVVPIFQIHPLISIDIVMELS